MKSERRYGIDRDTAQDHLEEWLEAEYELTTHQSYKLGSQELTLADLDKVRRQIVFWEQKVAALCGVRNRVWRVIPKDD